MIKIHKRVKGISMFITNQNSWITHIASEATVLARKRSFINEMAAALEFTRTHPNSWEVIEFGLTAMTASKSVNRWDDLKDRLESWSSAHHQPMLFSLERSETALPEPLRTEYVEEAKRLDRLRLLYGDDIHRARQAFRNPLGLKAVHADVSGSNGSGKHIMFSRNDGQDITFMVNDVDIAFLLTATLGLANDFIRQGGTIHPDEEFIELFSSLKSAIIEKEAIDEAALAQESDE